MTLITETPGLNKRANATVSISIANPSSLERISVGRTNRGWEGILSRWVDAAEVTP